MPVVTLIVPEFEPPTAIVVVPVPVLFVKVPVLVNVEKPPTPAKLLFPLAVMVPPLLNTAS